MIVAVMYGMMPSENTANFWSAPPENRFSRPRALPAPVTRSFTAVGVDARHRDVRADAVQRDDREREQDLLAEILDVERVREGGDHERLDRPSSRLDLGPAGAGHLVDLDGELLGELAVAEDLDRRGLRLDDALGEQRVDVDDVTLGEEVLEAATFTIAYSTRKRFLKPGSFGSRIASGFWPPSKPGPLPPPAREFWPLSPRPAGRPWPLPWPRPTRLRSLREPGAGKRSFNCMSSISLCRFAAGHSRRAAGRSPPADCHCADARSPESLDLLDLDQVLHLEDHAADRRRVRLLHGVVHALDAERADRRLLVARKADRRCGPA